MPSLTRRAALTVVAVLAATSLAGCGGGTDTAATDGVEDSATILEVTGTDALDFEPSRLAAPTGAVTVELSSGRGVHHTFAIDKLGDREVVEAAAGQTATGTVVLEPGTYTFYCSVPGHREAGMEGTLTVK